VTRLSRFVNIGLIGALVCVGAVWPTDSFAQRRATGRTATRVVVVPRFYSSPFYYSRFYYPWYYGSFYDPFFFGSPYYYGQYPYPPYYGRWGYDYTGSARLQVTPKNTQVYADGYFVGVVDNFDGSLQRLNLEAGQHELQLYLEGYQTFTQKVLFVRGRTLRIAHAMQPLGPGETSGPPPKPDASAVSARPAYRGDQGPRTAPPRGDRGERSAFGSLLLRVRPSDAEVIVDGERWDAPQGDDQFVIELAEGPHRIEVRKNGFQTYSTTVQVRRGQSVRLNVSLTTGDRSGEV
jgi:PEGA domain